MKPSGRLTRKTPMPRQSQPMKRTVPLQQGKGLRRTPLVATVPAKPRRQRDTGPTAKVRGIIAKRSGGWCEWIDCPHEAIHVHHRLGRKDGGRHGEMRHRLNQPAWLLHACLYHHDLVTDPDGLDRDIAEGFGWLLREHQDAREEPVLTRHSRALVVLDNAGGWTRA